MMMTGTCALIPFGGLQKFEAAHSGQLEIGDDEVECPLVENFKPVSASAAE